MDDNRDAIIALVKSELPNGEELGEKLRDETILAELGVTSMELITIVLSIQRKHDLNLERIIESGMPVTVGELVALLRSSL